MTNLNTNKQPKSPQSEDKSQKDEFSKIDPNKEFEEDDTTYDIQYYHDAIFLQKGNKDEIKYPCLISGYLNCCPIEKDLKGLSPLQIP